MITSSLRDQERGEGGQGACLSSQNLLGMLQCSTSILPCIYVIHINRALGKHLRMCGFVNVSTVRRLA